MANASAKKTAASNEVAIRNLQLGMLVAHGLYFLLRLLLPGNAFPPTMRQLTPYLLTAVPQFVLFQHLSSVGSPRRDAATSTLIAPGEDLNAPGVTEWCFDVIYVTWICQVGTSLFGEFVWWLYLSIPLYAGWKLYTFVIAPMFGLRSTGPSLAPPVAANGNGTAQTTSNGDAAESLSRKQQKAQKKAEKKGSGGIPRR